MRRMMAVFLALWFSLLSAQDAYSAGISRSSWKKEKSVEPGILFQEGSDAGSPENSGDSGDGGEKVDLNALKKKFKKGDLNSALDALKKGGIDELQSGGNSSGGGGTSTGGKPAGPLSVADMQQADDGPLNDNDKAYVKAHWINAKRNYKKKNYDRALEEITNILGVDKKHGESYLMRASILAMRKSFLDCWRALEKAKKFLPGDAKVGKFEETLSKASPKPDGLADEGTSVARPPAKFASQAVLDAVENLFADRSTTAKVSNFANGAAVEADGKVSCPFTFSGNESLDADTLEKKLKEVSRGEVKDKKPKNDGKSVDMVLTISGLPVKNPDVKPLKDITEFMKIISEETDVKIDKSEEGNIEPDKVMTGTYTLLARGISDINTFLHKLSPHTESYFLEKMELTSINSQVLWKGNAKIRIKTE